MSDHSGEAEIDDVRPKVRLILASGSPRRALLLAASGITFDVRVPNVDESPRKAEPPSEYVLRLSDEKASSIPLDAGYVVLGADTTVVLDGISIGKPEDHDHAVSILMSLVGRSHSVLTGWTVKSSTAHRFGITESRVVFNQRSEADVSEYVDRTQPFDKAGAYALQGDDGFLVSSVIGSRSNVMGLPVGDVVPALEELGLVRSSPQGG
jgi:septum formation protein